jgi:2-dehydro-3-deoxyphosphogluconate aldolase/(4S)-4-hydroxy-2-oxoglutarate aldolase
LAEALVLGGLPIIEVTLRTPDALEGLAAMARQPDITAGAGTVRTARQMRDAVSAGAEFVVSPCLTDSLARAAAELGVPFLPGVATATEIQLAADAGFDVVKIFPAEASGGVAALTALADVFVDMRFVPTGGLDHRTAPAYLEHPRVLAVGGGWMVPTAERAAGQWDTVRAAISAAAGLPGAAR